ncbi:MAG: GIY-YIG nuclease family protein [Desulfobacteraceae bacterium]|nr:GIY-YIG nuclease family protein [Desulfobacteraceae bacterium]
MQRKKFGKTIKIFLMDSIPDGRMACELSNWSGKAYKIPRGMVKECSDRPELTSTGVYLLFGTDEEGTSKSVAYIGEAENIYRRLTQHLKEKDFWHEAVVFISKDDNLNKAHIKYLEHRMHELACKAGRFGITNGSIPTLSSISEPDMAEMEEFLENAKMIVPILGYKIFETLRKNNSESFNRNLFHIKAVRGADATGEPTSEGFVVLKGSNIAGSTVNSCAPSILKLRQSLMDQKIIVEENQELVLSSDHLFSSPSTAAAIVMGRTANGLIEWKTKDGKTLKTIENE